MLERERETARLPGKAVGVRESERMQEETVGARA
jgi:hypothetical protein